MMDRKIDRRVRYSKHALKEALLELLKEKSLNRISISEICRTADINRNTFYAHYATPQDLFREIEDEIIDSLITAMKTNEGRDDMILAGCRSLYELRDVITVLQGHEHYRILQELMTFSQQQYSSSPESGNDERAIFNRGGARAVITDWILHDYQKSPEEIASLISSFSNSLFPKEE